MTPAHIHDSMQSHPRYASASALEDDAAGIRRTGVQLEVGGSQCVPWPSACLEHGLTYLSHKFERHIMTTPAQLLCFTYNPALRVVDPLAWDESTIARRDHMIK